MNLDEMSINQLNLTLIGTESYLQACNDTIKLIINFLETTQKSNEQMWLKNIEEIKKTLKKKGKQQ